MSLLRPPNPNPLSLLWIGLFAYGLIVGYLNARDAGADRQAVLGGIKARHPLYRLQTMAELIIEWARGSGQVVGLVIGLVSIYIPPLPQVHLSGQQETRRIFFSLVVVMGLMLLEVSQDVIITTEYVRRRWAHRIVARLMRDHPPPDEPPQP